jgi:hypothetical protein
MRTITMRQNVRQSLDRYLYKRKDLPGDQKAAGRKAAGPEVTSSAGGPRPVNSPAMVAAARKILAITSEGLPPMTPGELALAKRIVADCEAICATGAARRREPTPTLPPPTGG